MKITGTLVIVKSNNVEKQHQTVSSSTDYSQGKLNIEITLTFY